MRYSSIYRELLASFFKKWKPPRNIKCISIAIREVPNDRDCINNVEPIGSEQRLHLTAKTTLAFDQRQMVRNIDRMANVSVDRPILWISFGKLTDRNSDIYLDTSLDQRRDFTTPALCVSFTLSFPQTLTSVVANPRPSCSGSMPVHAPPDRLSLTLNLIGDRDVRSIPGVTAAAMFSELLWNGLAAAQLAVGAEMRRKLRRHATPKRVEPRKKNCLIQSDGCYSMQSDIAQFAWVYLDVWCAASIKTLLSAVDAGQMIWDKWVESLMTARLSKISAPSREDAIPLIALSSMPLVPYEYG
ncbi:hypothetical protein B0J13DRAFT_525054 [Dactylonectria estremocensis]|uniref:Uncharacterized protein n=1 Tax=Dactylonectria estremocensis TaxID=1079267 RepID=A0A9P9EV17_9HYPO|nr:hypothetical protein B0J13DRAFT_525054 [Dactylonectria estremocensis]